MFKQPLKIAALSLGLATAAFGQNTNSNAGYQQFGPNYDEVQWSQDQARRNATGTTVYQTTTTTTTTPDNAVRYYNYNPPANAPYYVNDRGERVYYSASTRPEQQGRVHYGAGEYGSAYDVHVVPHSGDDRNVGYVQREMYVAPGPVGTVYGNPNERVIVDRYYVVGPNEGPVMHEQRVYSGKHLMFHGTLVGINRVWSEALNGYADIATVRQADGSLIDFHVKKWHDLELNHFKLGDTVAIRADAKDMNGRNVLVLDEINRK